MVNGTKMPFDLPTAFNLNEFFIVSKLKEEKKQALGLRKGSVDDWQPILLDEDENIPYVVVDGVRLLVMRDDDHPWTIKEKVATGAAIAAGSVLAGVGAVLVAPVAIAALGFGAGGILGGSIATTMMSYGVVGVATLQSIGAAGMGAASIFVVGGTAATATATVGAAYNYIKTKDGKQVNIITLYPRPEDRTRFWRPAPGAPYVGIP
jgi:hypothetical protein